MSAAIAYYIANAGFWNHSLQYAKHGEWIRRHGLKSSQNAVNLKKPQIALLQNVELKVKPLVPATTVRSITVRVIFFGEGAKWEMARRPGYPWHKEMAWASVQNSSRGQRTRSKRHSGLYASGSVCGEKLKVREIGILVYLHESEMNSSFVSAL